MANISEIVSRLTGGGARANQFKVTLSFPSWVELGNSGVTDGTFLVKSAELPSSTIGVAPVKFRGKTIKLAGEREFENTQMSFYGTTDYNLLNAFEQWSSGVSNYDTTLARGNPADYYCDLLVQQLDRGGAIIKQYKLIDAWPVNVGGVELDMENENAVELIPVTWAYNYYLSDTGATAGYGV